MSHQGGTDPLRAEFFRHGPETDAGGQPLSFKERAVRPVRRCASPPISGDFQRLIPFHKAKAVVRHDGQMSFQSSLSAVGPSPFLAKPASEVPSLVSGRPILARRWSCVYRRKPARSNIGGRCSEVDPLPTKVCRDRSVFTGRAMTQSPAPTPLRLRRKNKNARNHDRS